MSTPPPPGFRSSSFLTRNISEVSLLSLPSSYLSFKFVLHATARLSSRTSVSPAQALADSVPPPVFPASTKASLSQHSYSSMTGVHFLSPRPLPPVLYSCCFFPIKATSYYLS